MCPCVAMPNLIVNSDTPIVCVIGGSGAGRMIQCQKIVQNYGFTHLSTGDILRKAGMRRSKSTRCLNYIMEGGGLVPNKLVLSLLKEEIEVAASKGARGYVVDGYPREKAQGIDFERTVGHISVSIETMAKQLATKAETTGREDDNMETIKPRLLTILQNNRAVRDFYNDRASKVDAEQDPDMIFAEIRNVLDPIVAPVQVIETKIADEAAIP